MTIKSNSKFSFDGSFELQPCRCTHDPSFMALAPTVSEKMAYKQKKKKKNWQSQLTIKYRSRLSTEGSFELHSSRCLNNPSVMALAPIVSKKMT